MKILIPIPATDKAIALFQFVKGLNELKQKVVQNAEDYRGTSLSNQILLDVQNQAVN